MFLLLLKKKKMFNKIFVVLTILVIVTFAASTTNTAEATSDVKILQEIMEPEIPAQCSCCGSGGLIHIGCCDGCGCQSCSCCGNDKK